MADIFLSYAREDAARASVFAEALESLGWSVWWDRRLPTGKDFNLYILEQLAAARCILVLWSAASVESPFVRDEASKGLPDGRLVPVRIDITEPPLGFGQLHTTDLSGWTRGTPHDEFDRLIASIREVVPPSAGRPGSAQPELHRLTLRTVEFVYVPAGTFAMGTPRRRAEELARAQRRPEFIEEAERNEVSVGAFYMARYPVTNAQYKAFVDETRAAVPYRRTDPWSTRYSWDQVTRSYPPGLERHPVVLVSWTQARRYCAWLGARLPTEAEWEKAARGRDGRAWPWGNDWQNGRCNTSEQALDGLSAVGTFSPGGDSPYGAADMSGNSWEWCSSMSDPYPYRADDGREEQGAEGRRVLRGGAFEQDRFMGRCATRNAAHQDDCGFTIGFRPACSPAAVAGSAKQPG